jgi:formimidoylglutamate deiminase
MWLLPDFAWSPSGLLKHPAVEITPSGKLGALLHPSKLPPGARVEPLPGRALLPGFVNVHSHAFQHGFRGQTEFLHHGREEEDFWSWREQMYDHALKVGEDEVYEVALDLYREMLAAGTTCVGEFHYLHHQPDGRLYDEPDRLARAVIEAARDAGIRVALLATLYHTRGPGLAALPEQRRFVWPDVEGYLGFVEGLLARYGDDPLVSVGLAPHSIRAVPRAWLGRLAAWNRAHGLPVHMHICEQPAEVEACRSAYGMTPLEVVEAEGLLDERFVAVHATHLTERDVALLAQAGARVCACPSTEANLGDGFLPARALVEAGVGICTGSDSHILIDPWSELRRIEENERLQRQRRSVVAAALGRAPRAEVPGGLEVVDDHPRKWRVAPGLLDMGARQGALALGVEAGVIAPGMWADLIAVDLGDHALRSVPPAWLPEALVFSAGPRAVSQVWVAGRQVF